MRSPVVTNDLKMEDSVDVDKIYFVLAQSIARARGEPDLKKRVEAMETANAIAEAKLKAAQAKIIEKEESAMNSKFSDNHIVTELDEKVAYDEELSASIIKQIKEDLLRLGEMPWRDQEEGDLKAQIAWFSDTATIISGNFLLN